MNILFFIKPKAEVAYIDDHDSLRQAMEKMEHHQYTAIPLLSRAGTYIGTITEGDLLWYCKNQLSFNLKTSESISITDLPRRASYQPVKANSNMEDLISLAMDQNFVPVTDDTGHFIGIITRKALIDFTYNKLCEYRRDSQKQLS